jgi:hypothetical protein
MGDPVAELPHLVNLLGQVDIHRLVRFGDPAEAPVLNGFLELLDGTQDGGVLD